MAYIDKLLNKFNKVKNAVNSIKGIQSKIQSINYTTAIDALGIEKGAAEELIKSRRSSLEKQLSSSGMARGHSAKPPSVRGTNIVYPFHDRLENYLVFDIRPRKARGEFVSHAVHKNRTIALYVPDAVISQAAVTYRNEGINTFQRTIDDLITNFEGFDGSITEGAKKMGTKFLQNAVNSMQGGLTNLKAGRATNPLQEQFLDGVPFRSWDFTFDFWAKSADEAAMVNEIIYTFRSSMLPDAYSESFDFDSVKGDGKLTPDQKQVVKDADLNASYFNYPNVFEISFEGPMGSKVDGFLPAVCTNAQVDYTGGQKFSTFADGNPVHIQLTLNFLEIKTMTLGNYESISPTAVYDGNRPYTTDTAFNVASQQTTEEYNDTIDKPNPEDPDG
tara:strand:- start:109 stop:1275 length:1167 start_codon:yes stop_codon:yes gene_type:complete